MTMISNAPCSAATASLILRRITILFARLGRLVNRGIAVTIARREREAALFALRHLNSRKLKDIGIYRYRIGEVLPETAEARVPPQRQRSLVFGGNEPTVGADRLAVEAFPSRSPRSS